MDKFLSSPLTLLAMLVFLGVMAGVASSRPAPVCLERSAVKEITALHYREAELLLENGQMMTVYQATLKPGDVVCFQYEK